MNDANEDEVAGGSSTVNEGENAEIVEEVQDAENVKTKTEAARRDSNEIEGKREENEEGGQRAPFTRTHTIERERGKYHLLLGVTGSIATIKLKELIGELYRFAPKDKLFIKVVATECAMRMIATQDWADDIDETIYEDRDEWSMWRQRDDPVLHIELRRWADCLLIAPLDANTMAKIANGLCDNLLTSMVRAWDPAKPCYFAPAMNTFMWESYHTYQHRKLLKDTLKFQEIPPIEKTLMCGDKGMGAMATTQMIATVIASLVKAKIAVYTPVCI